MENRMLKIMNYCKKIQICKVKQSPVEEAGGTQRKQQAQCISRDEQLAVQHLRQPARKTGKTEEHPKTPSLKLDSNR